MSNICKEYAVKLAEAIQQPEDYTGEDGLLYCGKCRTPKQRYFPEGLNTLGIDRHRIDCECEKIARLEREAAEQRRKHLDTVSDLQRRCFSVPKMTGWNFANDNGKTPQMEYARRYVERWDEVKASNMGYFLWGNSDSGKSYLAACIANGLMEKEISVRMTSFPIILNDLGASFEGRNEYIERLCRFPLLIIDDLGVENWTEYNLVHVYNVIDYRCRCGMPLILTANISPDELNSPPDIAHARIYSRILDMCVPIHVTGEQNRKENGQRKMELLKEIMNN